MVSCVLLRVPTAPSADLGQTVDRSERMLVKADGSRMPILKTVVQIKLGGKDHLLESFIDNTERKQAEAALLASEERFRRFTEVTIEALVFHEQGRIVDANPAGLAMFGISEQHRFRRQKLNGVYRTRIAQAGIAANAIGNRQTI